MNHGRDDAYLSIDDDKSLSKEDLAYVASKRFSFVRMGHSMRATELEAAIGVAQFEDRVDNVKRRRAIAKYYSEGLSHLEKYMQLPTIPDDREHNFMMYPIVLKGQSKWELVNYLESRNIETREMVPLTNQPVYKNRFHENFEKMFPIAKWINDNGFYIGSHPYLKKEETKYIVETINDFFK